MSNFVSLDDAAKKLGVSTDELVEMRSRGEIFGYRDGGSWKFKPEEIERVAGEMGGALDEDPAGSSLLGSALGSDLLSGDDASSDASSDVALVPEPGEGSDVRLVASQDDDLQLADSDDDDDELELASDDGADLTPASNESSDLELMGSDLELADGSALSGVDEVSLGSDLQLASEDPSGVLSGSGLSLGSDANQSDLITGDSDPAIDSGALGSDLELSDDGDLVLGGGSDLALGNDSGINLMSPADSGISLEDEPLDLAASGISGLDLAAEGSDVESPSASGSAVDFQQDEEFQLSASGSLDVDEDDSGSQVIELEDSSEFGDGAVALPASGDEGFDAFSDVDGGGGLDEADSLAAGAPAAAMASPEIPYSMLEVLMLLSILLVMCLSGILVTDVVRNMWSWTEQDSALTSGFTDMVLSALSLK
ncbi:MAG: helix-turn-helix domain-containing protein [Planctomycetota bacterium]